MRTFTGADDLVASVGEQLGPTDWVVIDQDRIDRFAEATGDHQWIHVDPERAASGPFGATIAHGFLTLTLVPEFLSTLYRVEGVQLGLNYGVNKVRMPAPVVVDSRIRATTTVSDVTELEGAAQVVWSTVVEIEGGEKPACVAETVVRYVFAS